MPMLVNEKPKLSHALVLHPDVLEYIIELNPHDFARLRNPLMRRLMRPRITLKRIAQMTDMDIRSLLRRIHEIAQSPLTEHELDALSAMSSVTEAQSRTSGPEPPEWVLEAQPVVVDLLASDDRLDADPMVPIPRALKSHPIGTVVLINTNGSPSRFMIFGIAPVSNILRHLLTKRSGGSSSVRRRGIQG